MRGYNNQCCSQDQAIRDQDQDREVQDQDQKSETKTTTSVYLIDTNL